MATEPGRRAQRGTDVLIGAVSAEAGVVTDTPDGDPVPTIVLEVSQHVPGGGPGAVLRLHIPAELIMPLVDVLPDLSARAHENVNEIRARRS